MFVPKIVVPTLLWTVADLSNALPPQLAGHPFALSFFQFHQKKIPGCSQNV